MADKITGHGHPSNHLKGEVGQYYEDLDTGDLYECRSASEYSKLNGRPFGGYVWELRAKGEDIREIYGSSGGGDKPKAIFIDPNKASRYEYTEEVGEKVYDALLSGVPCYVLGSASGGETDYTQIHSFFEEEMSSMDGLFLRCFYHPVTSSVSETFALRIRESRMTGFTIE